MRGEQLRTSGGRLELFFWQVPAQVCKGAQEVRGTSVLRGPEWNVDETPLPGIQGAEPLASLGTAEAVPVQGGLPLCETCLSTPHSDVQNYVSHFSIIVEGNQIDSGGGDGGFVALGRACPAERIASRLRKRFLSAGYDLPKATRCEAAEGYADA